MPQSISAPSKAPSAFNKEKSFLPHFFSSSDLPTIPRNIQLSDLSEQSCSWWTAKRECLDTLAQHPSSEEYQSKPSLQPYIRYNSCSKAEVIHREKELGCLHPKKSPGALGYE